MSINSMEIPEPYPQYISDNSYKSDVTESFDFVDCSTHEEVDF